MEIPLSRCLLRPFRPGDEASIVRSANDGDVWRNLRDQFPHPYTLADANAWVARNHGATTQTTFAIDDGGAVVGGIGFVLQSDIYRRSAELGYWLAASHWGRGIATEAVRAVTSHALEAFDLVRIFAAVFEHNRASARVVEKAGYALEGRLRKSVFKDGELLDSFLYAYVR